jgi:hypothetical protein
MDATGATVSFGNETSSSFNSAKAAAMDAKGEAVAYGQSISNIPTSWTTDYYLNYITTGDTSGGSCFTGNTLVWMSDGTHKRIDSVAVGDIVKSYNTVTKEFISASVTDLYIHNIFEYIVVNKICATPEHVVYINSKWQPIGNAVIGDKLISENGEEIEVTSISKVLKSEKVYNLHTDNDVHNYFAGGILVHNWKNQGNKIVAGMAAPQGAMQSPYAAQQQPVIDYNLLATAIRDAIAPLIK